MAKERKGNKKSMVMLLLLLLVLTPFLRYVMLIFVLGMLPAFVASYVDTSSGRNLTRVVSTCNLAGVLPILVRIWQRGISFDNMWLTFTDANAWLQMYGAAAFGWLIYWFFPRAVHFLLELSHNNKVALLKSRQEKIIDEWGVQVDAASRRAIRNIAYSEDKKKKKEAQG